MVTNIAKQAGFKEAKMNRFVYTHLSGDDYYIQEIEDDEEIFMVILFESKEKKDVNTDPIFDNLNGRYKIKELYDESRGVYRYYIGKPISNIGYADAFRKELKAMGYSNVRIVQFIYSTLKFEEHYIDYKDDSEEISFVLGDNSSVEKVKEMTVYFGFDQYYLSKKYRDQIDGLLSKTKGKGYIIVLEGHTDSIGEESYNFWLSKMRAMSVKKYMVNSGVNPDSITIIPKGELSPIHNNDSLKNRQLNRSVVILPKKE